MSQDGYYIGKDFEESYRKKNVKSAGPGDTNITCNMVMHLNQGSYADHFLVDMNNVSCQNYGLSTFGFQEPSKPKQVNKEKQQAVVQQLQRVMDERKKCSGLATMLLLLHKVNTYSGGRIVQKCHRNTVNKIKHNNTEAIPAAKRTFVNQKKKFLDNQSASIQQTTSKKM